LATVPTNIRPTIHFAKAINRFVLFISYIARQGLLFLVCPLSQGQTKRKIKLCALCASSEAGGEMQFTPA
jgi:hypothetical protein